MKRTNSGTGETEQVKRFSFSDNDLTTITTPKPPTTTTHATQWAYRNFTEWRTARNSSFSGEISVPDIFESPTIETINKWLSYYIIETRNVRGEKYPPKTLYQLMCGLLRHGRLIKPLFPNFMDLKNLEFKPLHNAMDNVFKELRKEGIGSQTKRAEVLSKNDEDLLWKTEAIGLHDPLSLLRAVFLYNGKNLCLRGGIEHRELRISQFKREYNPDWYIYTPKFRLKIGLVGIFNWFPSTLPQLLENGAIYAFWTST